MIYHTEASAISGGKITFANVHALYEFPDMPHKVNIGANIERIMRERGYNPSRLAREAGFGHTTVRDIIQGRSSSPRYATLEKLANVLGVAVEDLTGQTPPPGGQDTEMHYLWSRLTPEEKTMILNVAKAQIGARDH